MAKNRDRHGNQEAEAASAPSTAQPTQPVEAAAQPTENRVLIFKRNHPQNRCSYGIPGVPGIVVIQRDLFAGTTPVAPTGSDLGGMPAILTVDALLVQSRQDNKAAKAEAVAAKLAERAAKATQKAEAQAAKLVDRQKKADEALAAAKAKADAALAAAQAKVGEPATV